MLSRMTQDSTKQHQGFLFRHLYEAGHSTSWGLTPRAFASARMVLGLGRLPLSAEITVVLETLDFRANSACVRTARNRSSLKVGMDKEFYELILDKSTTAP